MSSVGDHHDHVCPWCDKELLTGGKCPDQGCQGGKQNADARVAELLDRWVAAYNESGGSTDFPFPEQWTASELGLTDDCWDDPLFLAAAELFERAAAADPDFFDNFQGYHDEWPEAISRAKAQVRP